MTMNNIKITLPEVSSAANNIRNINANMDDILNDVSKMMNDLTNVWKGTAGEEIVSRFKRFSSRFIDESQTIDEYAKYLDYTVSSYDSLESTLSSNASNFE